MADTEEKNTIPSKQNEEDRVIAIDEWYAVARQAESSFLNQAAEDEKFYGGDQWKVEDKRKLEEDGKPALTYNYIFSLVNLINGYYRQNKMDIKVHNGRGGSREVADILQKIVKHTHQMKNGEWETAYAHLMGCITGKSYLMLNIDYDDDLLNGDLYIEHFSCFDILVDPFGTRYDLTDREYFFKSVWMPKEKINRMYPNKLKGGFEVSPNDRISLTGEETFNYKDAADYQQQEENDIEQFRYRVKECWWKEYVESRFLINVQTGKVHNVSELKSAEIKKITDSNPLFRQIKRTKPEMHMSQYVGKTELYHAKAPLGGMKNFPIVGFFPYFMRKTSQGVITQLKDPQKEHNKRMSQALHHLNQSANSGYTADADAVDDWDELERNISKAGYIKKIKPGKRFDKDHPTELSTGHIALANAGATAIKLISGVNSDLLGSDSSETVSGVAIARRQAQGLMTTEIIHDNCKFTLKILGDRMVEGIQKSGAYSKDEVLNLVIDGNESPVEINKKVEETNRILNDVSVGRYDTSIGISIQTPTARMANYMTMLEAIKLGAPIPPEVLVDASDWPDKEKIKKSMDDAKAAQQEAGKIAMAEKEKDRQLEIKKIEAKTQGDLLVKAQDAHLAIVKDGDKNNAHEQRSRK